MPRRASGSSRYTFDSTLNALSKIDRVLGRVLKTFRVILDYLYKFRSHPPQCTSVYFARRDPAFTLVNEAKLWIWNHPLFDPRITRQVDPSLQIRSRLLRVLSSEPFKFPLRCQWQNRCTIPGSNRINFHATESIKGPVEFSGDSSHELNSSGPVRRNEL